MANETIEFKNGAFYIQLDWEAQSNIETNTSTIKITSLRFMTTLWYGITYYLKGSVIIGDHRISVDDGSVHIESKNNYYEYNGSLEGVSVNHLADGSLTLAIGVDIRGYTTSGGAGNGWNVVGSNYVTLPTIPRASTITSAANTILGKACSVQWTPASTEFKYKLTFAMGKGVMTTDFILPKTTALYTYSGYTIPLDAAAVIPNDTNGTMTVTLYTYSASEEQIGTESSTTITVTVPDNEYTKPTVSIDALTPVTSLASPFDTIFVQGKSKVKVSYTGKGKFYATITSYSVSIGGKIIDGDTSDFLSDYGTVTIKVTATDSRGFSNSVTDTIEVIPYAKPKMVTAEGENDVICARCDGDGNLVDTGTALKVKVKRSYSKVESDGTQNNACRMWLEWKLASAPDSAYSDPVELICTNDTYDGIIDSVIFNAVASYTVTIYAQDDVGEKASMTFTILSEKVYWHRGEDFLALGMRSSSGGFECAWPARFYGDVKVGDVSLADYIRNIISEGG